MLGKISPSWVKYVIYGQVIFIISALICIAVMPKGLAANGGFSYYGNFSRTIIPYSLGLLLAGSFIFLAARITPKRMPFTPVKYVTYLISVLLFVALMSPYKADWGWAHRKASIVVFILQLLIAVWIVIMINWNTATVLLLALLVLVIIFTAFSLQPGYGFLIQGELLYQMTFTALFAKTLAVNTTQPVKRQ